MPGVSLQIKVKWTRLDANKLMRSVEAESKSALESARTMARSVLIRNIGTQYFDLRQLRAMGHPYSRIHGMGRPGGIPLGVVNRQSGGFYESFFIRVAYTGRRYSLLVGQNGPEQAQGNWLLEGTIRMRGRPWQKYLRSEIAKVVRPYLQTRLNERLKLTVKAFGVNSFPKG